MSVVRDEYLENKRCRWMEEFRVMVCGKMFEILVPPGFEEEDRKIMELIARLRDEQYENIAVIFP